MKSVSKETFNRLLLVSKETYYRLHEKRFRELRCSMKSGREHLPPVESAVEPLPHSSYKSCLLVFIYIFTRYLAGKAPRGSAAPEARSRIPSSYSVVLNLVYTLLFHTQCHTVTLYATLYPLHLTLYTYSGIDVGSHGKQNRFQVAPCPAFPLPVCSIPCSSRRRLAPCIATCLSLDLSCLRSKPRVIY
jgi:hypothetical protein